MMVTPLRVDLVGFDSDFVSKKNVFCVVLRGHVPRIPNFLRE